MPRFCTAVDDGQRCTYRALPGQRFCCGHHPNPVEPRLCEYLNIRGARCSSLAMRGQDHCFAHSPRNRRRQSPRKHIGTAPALSCISSVLSSLPEPQRAILEALYLQQLATAPSLESEDRPSAPERPPHVLCFEQYAGDSNGPFRKPCSSSDLP